ncbi:MAG: acyl carrier protein [Actinobacteria bacterium]|nr:MAG: acyl carrier protein [Actinomycetota bacterium]
MRTDLEATVRERVAQVVEDVPADELDLDADLADEYSLTSLNKVLLVTMVCDDADVDLANFTEHDLARMRTTRQIISALSPYAQTVAGA